MTRIVETAEGFVEDALEGFARVHSDTVQRVDGGIVRANSLPPRTVAVVIGGGSGHYPAFAGLVGEGLAAGAVCGNIFASPSAGQAHRVARAAEVGGGVLFSYGNYAGDVLHFGEAERRLNGEGIETRTVLVTDDIASAPADEVSKRRGIAGDLCVFRIAAAAAERGEDLDEVERLARVANDRTRTLGVAFGGCTLPGATEPLFVVPDGMMSVGLGIHGEPGIRDVPMQSAKELAHTLVTPLLAERPTDAAARVVAILNGLGSVKYEELFVLFRYVSDRLAAAGITVVQPECGELVTSLDMSGVSLTLLWLDDELESLWSAPVNAPAYRKGTIETIAGSRPVIQETPISPETPTQITPKVTVSAASARAAALAAALANEALKTITAHADELGKLDAIAGDGDHGVGMVRGLEAVRIFAKANGKLGIRELLIGAGDAWSESAGGTSGALWGGALAAFGETLGERESYPAHLVSEAVHAAVARILQLGGAVLGDKTMVDALIPFDRAFYDQIDSGAPLAAALAEAALAADAAAQATAELSPRLGRARPLAERSIGHADPGATSFALIVSSLKVKEGGTS